MNGQLPDRTDGQFAHKLIDILLNGPINQTFILMKSKMIWLLFHINDRPSNIADYIDKLISII